MFNRMFFWNRNNEAPMTQAVIDGNLELVKRLSYNTSHRNAENFLGLTADDLAVYLLKEEMVEMLGLSHSRRFKVLKKGESEVVEMGISEYESFFQTKYVASVISSSHQELYKLIKKCPKIVKTGDTGSAMRALFEENREKIKSGYVADSTIKWIDEGMGYGLFANVPIKKGEMVGEYTGLLIVRHMLTKYSGDYFMRYPHFSFGLMHYTLDADRFGNEMRFANHNYTPNMQPTVALEKGLSHSVLIALRDIEPGEQLTYDYGEDYWSRRDPPRDF